MRLALVPSPFVGATSWRFVASLLDDADPVNYGGVGPPDWFDGPSRRIAEQFDAEPWIAVLHSSAGPFAPSLAACSSRLRGLIFVDAVLPHPGESAAQRAQPGQIEALRRMTFDGAIAPWRRWFPEGLIEAWVPDETARNAVLADTGRVRPLCRLRWRGTVPPEEAPLREPADGNARVCLSAGEGVRPALTAIWEPQGSAGISR